MPLTSNRPDPDQVRSDVEDDAYRRSMFQAYRLAGMGVDVIVSGVAHDKNTRRILLDLVEDLTGRIPSRNIFPTHNEKR